MNNSTTFKVGQVQPASQSLGFPVHSAADADDPAQWEPPVRNAADALGAYRDELIDWSVRRLGAFSRTTGGRTPQIGDAVRRAVDSNYGDHRRVLLIVTRYAEPLTVRLDVPDDALGSEVVDKTRLIICKAKSEYEQAFLGKSFGLCVYNSHLDGVVCDVDDLQERSGVAIEPELWQATQRWAQEAVAEIESNLLAQEKEQQQYPRFRG